MLGQAIIRLHTYTLSRVIDILFMIAGIAAIHRYSLI